MKFEALWPLAKSAAKPLAMSPKLAGGDAKRFGFLWNYVFRGEQMFPLLQAGLAEAYSGSEFVSYSAFGNVHGHDEAEVLAELPRRLREARLDAVVVGVGA